MCWVRAETEGNERRKKPSSLSAGLSWEANWAHTILTPPSGGGGNPDPSELDYKSGLNQAHLILAPLFYGRWEEPKVTPQNWTELRIKSSEPNPPSTLGEVEGTQKTLKTRLSGKDESRANKALLWRDYPKYRPFFNQNIALCRCPCGQILMFVISLGFPSVRPELDYLSVSIACSFR